MRRAVGVLLVLVGGIVAIAGTALMVLLGPDDRATTGPHRVDTVGVAVVTTPRAIAYAGPTVSVLAEVPDDKPVFVGLGNAVDVRDYLGKTERLTIERVRVPWRISTRQDAGTPNLTASPTALDWWIAQSAGLGGASITVPLPDEPVSLAILSVGDSDLEGLRVTTAYDVGGGFLMGGGGVATGLGLALLGATRLRRRPDADAGRDDVDDTRYVYVDDDGVEHDVARSELDGYEVVEEPATRASTPSAETATEPEEEVVYVVVDEDGREREIPAAEAEGLEVVEERVEEAPPSDDDAPGRDEPGHEGAGGWRARLRRALGVE